MSDATNQETVDIANQILAELQQAARDGQLIQNDYYATEAAGRAAVADGETFKVQGVGDVAALLYRRIDASASALIGVFPAAKTTARIVDVAATEDRMLQLIAQADGGVGISNLVGFEREELSGVERAWVSERGTIVAQITDSEQFAVAGPDLSSGLQTGFRAGLCHILGIGQSWMGGTGGAPAITTAAQASILMFVGGIRPQDTLIAPDCYASLVPAVESNTAGNVRGETPMSGFARGLAAELLSTTGLTLADSGSQLLLSVVAPGGQALGGFTKGGTYWLQVVEQINAGYARAQALGETYRLLCCPFIIGKGDYDAGQPSQEGFGLTLGAMVDDLNAYMQALVPGHPPVPIVVIQTGSHGHAARQPTVDLALDELDRVHPNVVLGGTLSAYPRAVGDTVHFAAQSYFDAGYVAGQIAQRWLFTGSKPDVMLPVEYDAQGSVISLRYRAPKLPLALDLAGANNPANAGFDLLDGSGNALAISSVTAKHDRVVIVAAAALPASWTLRYAVSGAYVAGQISGPRGALRDTSATRNWAGLFEIKKSI